jgi:hypothetical protein
LLIVSYPKEQIWYRINIFSERCIGGHKANNFWPTVKSFLSKKSAGGQQIIVLKENNVILNDKKDVCDTFNSFFVNVANDIGKGIIFDENNQPSIDRIRKNTPKNNFDFDFKPTNRHYNKTGEQN